MKTSVRYTTSIVTLVLQIAIRHFCEINNGLALNRIPATTAFYQRDFSSGINKALDVNVGIV